MKVALVVHQVTSEINSNIETIKTEFSKAANHGVDLVLFPEAALTGLINNDIPSHDLPLGQTIPGAVTDILSGLCSEQGVWLALGLLERDGSSLYDTAVLIDPNGKIQLKYRRISQGWHGEMADPLVYCQGDELHKVETSLGSFAFLICGDLFDDSIIAQIRDISPDWVLFPFARCFSDDVDAQAYWDEVEKESYIARIKQTGVTTLMTNYLADKDIGGGAFGGAMVVRPDGFVLDSLPLKKTGILYIDLH